TAANNSKSGETYLAIIAYFNLVLTWLLLAFCSNSKLSIITYTLENYREANKAFFVVRLCTFDCILLHFYIVINTCSIYVQKERYVLVNTFALIGQTVRDHW